MRHIRLLDMHIILKDAFTARCFLTDQCSGQHHYFSVLTFTIDHRHQHYHHYFSGMNLAGLSCRHPAFYCFHQINAFESGDDLVIDLAAYPDHRIMVQLHRTNMLFGLDPLDAAIPTRSLVLLCMCNQSSLYSLNTRRPVISCMRVHKLSKS